MDYTDTVAAPNGLFSSFFLLLSRLLLLPLRVLYRFPPPPTLLHARAFVTACAASHILPLSLRSFFSPQLYFTSPSHAIQRNGSEKSQFVLVYRILYLVFSTGVTAKVGRTKLIRKAVLITGVFLWQMIENIPVGVVDLGLGTE